MAQQLQDSEIIAIRNLQMQLTSKFQYRPRTEKVIGEIEAEAIEGLAHLGWIASVDAFPILQGEQIQITLIQRVDPQYQFDHERKAYDVNKAREKGETIHGESESPT
jgi:hypothetical protein